MKSGILLTIAAAAALTLTAAAKLPESAEQKAFLPDFRTLKVENPDNFMAPVIRLGSADRLLFCFDEIGEDINYDLRYRILQCNADWSESRLLDSEITDGFNEAPAYEDAAFSSNTFVYYVNYQIEIPNDNISPLLSGNYLLQIYEETPENLVAQFRFMVSEGSATISGEATSRTDKGYNSEYQQLSLRLHPGGTKIRDPYSDIYITITQNGDVGAMHELSAPMRVMPDEIVYEHLPALIFEAGNEFRRFETVRADYPGMNVDSVRWGGSNYHAWVMQDRPRFDRPYSYDRTQFGRFKVDEYNATDPELGADYVTVHFALDTDPIAGDVYVDGDLAGRRLTDANRMTYNRRTGRYELEMPLKQGSYNYRYMVESKEGTVSAAPIEGNKYETTNEYFVAVYYREPGSRYDRLLTTAIIHTTP